MMSRVHGYRRTWNDYVSLATDEIRHFSTNSTQVQRRLRSLLLTLQASTPPTQHPPLVERLEALDQQVRREWKSELDIRLASVADPQGLGSESGGQSPRVAPGQPDAPSLPAALTQSTVAPSLVDACERARCASISPSNSARQFTVIGSPRVTASSADNSTGKPKVSDNLNKSLPVTVSPVLPRRLSSRKPLPRVRRKDRSSFSSTAITVSRRSATSG